MAPILTLMTMSMKNGKRHAEQGYSCCWSSFLSKWTEYAYIFVCREANKRPLAVSNKPSEYEPQQKKKAKTTDGGDEGGEERDEEGVAET